MLRQPDVNVDLYPIGIQETPPPKKHPKRPFSVFLFFFFSFHQNVASVTFYTVCRSTMSHTSKRAENWWAMTFLSQRSDGFRKIGVKASRNTSCHSMGGFLAPSTKGRAIHQNERPDGGVMCVKFGGPRLNGCREIPKKLKSVPQDPRP